MSQLDIAADVEYPESDGRPMGETDLHRNWMMRLFDLLSYHFREQQVYVSCDLLVYYERGNPARFVVPDHFVIKNCPPGERRVFKTWEEGKTPDVVFEVTSRSTRFNDTRVKPNVYAQLGVKEYFLYDPTNEYLTPPLQGFRLVNSAYERLEANSAGELECRELGLGLRLQEGRLVMYDVTHARPLLTRAEAEQQRADTEQQRADTERQRADTERQRADTERQRADTERQRADTERQRAQTEGARAEVERQRAQAEHARAENEHARAEVERERAESERQRREAAEAELQRLREQLDQQGW